MRGLDQFLPSYNGLYCKRITDVDRGVIAQGFSVSKQEGQNLETYLKNWALQDEVSGIARTYVVFDEKRSDEIVAYFSLKTGFVSTNEFKNGLLRKSFDALPGIELSNFAVNSKYTQKFPELKGVGLVVFRKFILPIVYLTAEFVGVNVLYIFALPYDNLINLYHKQYGFSRLNPVQEKMMHRRIRPNYDSQCIFMYQSL